MGKRGEAQEEEYFRKKRNEQLNQLKQKKVPSGTEQANIRKKSRVRKTNDE